MKRRETKRRNKKGSKRQNKVMQKETSTIAIPDLSQFDIFGIADDIWIDIICCLSFRELNCMKRVCKYFNQLYPSAQNTNKMDNRFDLFWKNNCNELCSNLSPNYTAQPNWHTFFIELRKFFINSEFEHKFEAKQTLKKVEFNIIYSDPKYKNIEKKVKQFSNPQYQYHIGNLKNIRMIDDCRAFYWACRIDSVMMFQMLLSKPKYNNNILHVFDKKSPTSKHYPLYSYFYERERLISRYQSRTILSSTLSTSLQTDNYLKSRTSIAKNKISKQILRYLFKQFSDEIGTNALIDQSSTFKCSLLIDVIRWCGDDQIIGLVLAHPAMTKEIINFQLKPSIVSEYSNAIECMCCVSPPKTTDIKHHIKPNTILNLIRKSDYNINTKTSFKGDTPLHSLCKRIKYPYFKNIATILLKAKDVVEKIDFNAKNNDGITALMILCTRDLSVPNNAYAIAKSQNFDVFRRLLNIKKLNINAQNNDGDTALMMLCGPFGNFECLKLLLAKRKDVGILVSNNNNYNAFHHVADSGNAEKVKLVFQYIKRKLKDKNMIDNFVNQQSKDTGDTPYVKACYATKYHKIGKNKKLLIELINTCQIDVSIKSNSGHYARHYVKNVNLKLWLRQQEEKSKHFKKEMKNAI